MPEQPANAAANRWSAVEGLFHACLEQPAESRAAFLAHACGSDVTLRGEVESLLAQVGAGDSLLERPAMAHAAFPGSTMTATSSGMTSRAPAFSLFAGEVIADRFEIIRGLGEGGMALVYEAIDRKLNARRALKFARPGYRQLIPQETRSALHITHENVCRTYEIHSAITSSGPADFISMELIEGETLLKRLQRENIPRPEALEIARQLCRGLASAHAAQIVHQDLKSNNVMLAQRVNGSLRVVIMDFGIAFSVGTRNDDDKATVGGTRDYIPPERWRGAAPSLSGDVYAMGVILYELLTGELPFPNIAPAQRLDRLPPPPSRAARSPDARWDSIVVRCLDPDPHKRFASGDDLLQTVERIFGGVTRRRVLAIAAVTAAATTPLVVFRDKIWPAPLAKLAILPLEGSTGDPSLDQAILGGLHDLGTRLESLSTSSRHLVSVPLTDTQRYQVTSASSAASRLGATDALLVKLSPRLAAFGVSAEIKDCKTDVTLKSYEGEFHSQDLAGLPVALAGLVTSTFHLNQPPIPKMAPAAYPYYAAGLTSLEAAPPDPDQAISSFEKSLQIDGKAAPALVGIAEAYLEKYRVPQDPASLDKAALFARRAYSFYPDSPAVLSALAEVERYSGHAERAIELLHRVIELEPNNANAWRRTGSALQQLGRDAEAVETVRHAVELAPDYFATHQSLGVIYFTIGHPREAVDEFATVTKLAPGLPEAFSNLGAAWVAAGNDDEAERALLESVRLEPTQMALNNLAVLQRILGQNGDAVATFARALKAGGDNAEIRLNLGNALLSVGKTDEARPQFVKAGELARATLRRNARDADARACLALSMARLGNPEAGADEALQAMQLAPSDYGVIFWAAMTLEVAGRRAEMFPLLASWTYSGLMELERQPDLAGMVHDPRFTVLLQKAQQRENIPTRR